MSCKYIDTSVAVARYIPDKHLQTQGYLRQIATTARAKQVCIDGIDCPMSMGQLAALLLFRTIGPPLRSTRSIVALLSFEESTEQTPLCMTSPVYRSYDIDEVSRDIAAALHVDSRVRERARPPGIATPVMQMIEQFYPRGCATCIYNLSALIIKATLCYDIVSMTDPRDHTGRFYPATEVMCDIICGYAFNNKYFHSKHRLMHMFQTAMLLEPRFISTCVDYSEEIDKKLRLKVYKKKVAIDGPHVNQHKSLHDAISTYMGYDVTLVIPYICVVSHIAMHVFATIGRDMVDDFIHPPKKNSKNHCILTEQDTDRVVYYL